MSNIQVERVVVQVAIVDVGLDDAVRRLRVYGWWIRRVVRIAAQAMLRVPVDPVGTGAVGVIGRTHLILGGTDEGRRSIHIERTNDSQRVRADIVETKYPAPSEAMLEAGGVLLGVGVQERVGISIEYRRGKVLIQISRLARADVETTHRGYRSRRKRRQGGGGYAGRKANLAWRRSIGEYAGGFTKGIAGEGVVDDLRGGDTKASAEDDRTVAKWVVNKTDTWGEVKLRIS